MLLRARQPTSCSRAGKPVRDRAALFGFTTTAAIATSMLTAEYVGVDDWKSQMASLGLTILIVTPATFIFKCFQGFLSDMKCLLEMVTVFFMTATVYWAATRPKAADVGFQAVYGLIASWVVEAPSHIFKYLYCATFCPCCVPKKSKLNTVDDIAREYEGGAPELHVNIER